MNAADALLAQKETIARAVTAALYHEKPELVARYGETGRVRCLEDMHYNIEHLAPAIALQQQDMFTRYVIWLRDMLGARNVPADDVRRSLQLLAEQVQAHLPAEHAQTIVPVIAAGVAVLDG